MGRAQLGPRRALTDRYGLTVSVALRCSPCSTLPERPNGSTGWVRAADVDVEHVDHEIRIDLAARALRWTERGNVVLETPIAVGSQKYPTPAGRFFVTDLLDTG
jgi:L,D-transpeptidase catalytic domain